MDEGRLYLILKALGTEERKLAKLVDVELNTLKTTRRKKKPEEMNVAMYLRKSEERETEQVHSIGYQKRECLRLAKCKGLKIDEKKDIFIEKHSARYAGGRETFLEVIEKVVMGEYDAILAYHPDRLVRNMFEAGLIMDMLKPIKKGTKNGKKSSEPLAWFEDDHSDEDPPILQALFFPTVEFANDSSGRMMLAVLFSMATQYSDHLSENIKNGMDDHFKVGKSCGARKWGYIRDEVTECYVPDENWKYIKKGWEMILDGKSQVEILEYWKKSGVSRWTKPKNGKPPEKQYLQSTSAVSRLFHDRFAYGINKKDNQIVDLRKEDPNFKPMVTEEEFSRVKAMLRMNHQSHRKHKNTNDLFFPLRGCVFCATCKHKMYPVAARKNKSVPYKYVYYQCRNKECPDRPSIRGKGIFKKIYKALDTLKIDERTYQEYMKTVKAYSASMSQDLKDEKKEQEGYKAQAKARLEALNRKIEGFASLRSDGVVVDKETIEGVEAKKKNEKQIIKECDEKIKELEAQIKDPELVVLLHKSFVNLIENSADEMRKRNWLGKDQLFRKIFVNLAVTNKKEVILTCNKDFEGLLSMSDVLFGGVTGIQTLDLRLAKAAL